MTLLSCTNLSVARGGQAILEGVTLELKAGDVLILQGPNGAGKTTLLRTLAGLQKPMNGSVTVEPDDIAYGAHADGLKSTLSVQENLQFWASVYGQTGIENALTAFDLQDLRTRAAGRLSAGQKRRLSLARLEITKRPIWILDEPTVSLDRASVTLFASSVQAHVAAGGAAIIATHIDLGLTGTTLDVAQFAAIAGQTHHAFDDAFEEDFI